MAKETTHSVIFGGHSIGQVRAVDEQQAGERAASLALDFLTDTLGFMCNDPGVNRIAQRVKVLDRLEAAFGAVCFDVTHVPAGQEKNRAGGVSRTMAKCYVNMRRTDQPLPFGARHAF